MHYVRHYGLRRVVILVAQVAMLSASIAPAQTNTPANTPASAAAVPDRGQSYYATGRVETHLDPSGGRRQVVVGLPSAQSGHDGELWVQPSVDIFTDRTPSPSRETGPFGVGFLGTEPLHFNPAAINGPGLAVEQLPFPSLAPGYSVLESELLPGGGENAAEPIFEEILAPGNGPVDEGEFFYGFQGGGTTGIGHERVMHAPFVIDTTQPFGNFAFKSHMYGGQNFPDRAELFWASNSGRGPPIPESAVNFQEVRLKLELGKGKFSTTTEVPFRWVDPQFNRNHAGLGDLTTATKTVMVDGESWQITQFFKSYFNTGSPGAGLGTGHISLEPGFLFRYRWSDITYLHSEIKYRFPLGGDPRFAGELLQYGFGVSHLWIENDTFAVMPTLELVGWNSSGGLATVLNPLDPMVPFVSADGIHVFNLYPGLRIVHDTNCDLGLLELGVRGGFPLTSDRWHDGHVGLEMRFSF